MTFVVPQQLGRMPSGIQCPSCHAQVVTATTLTLGLGGWLAVGLLFFTLGWLCLCFIPCCVDSCKDVSHTCPQCGAFLGKNRAFFD